MIACIVSAFACLGILVLCLQQARSPVFPLSGGGYFEVMETAHGSNMIFHIGDRQCMALYRIFGHHVPDRYKTLQHPFLALGTNSLGVLLNKPITKEDYEASRALNGSFSLSLLTEKNEEFFGLQRVVNFQTAKDKQGRSIITDEQIIFEFTNPPPTYTRLRMYQTNVSNGTVTVTTNEIPFTPDH
jgi:hypothetical protein